MKTDTNLKISKSRSAASDLFKDLNVHVQAILSSIPGVGGALLAYFSEIRSRLAIQRVEKLFAELAASIHQTEISKINQQYIQSESFGESCVRAALDASRTASEFKIRKIAQILTNSLYQPLSKNSTVEYFIHLIGLLNEQSIHLLFDLDVFERKDYNDEGPLWKEVDVWHWDQQGERHYAPSKSAFGVAAIARIAGIELTHANEQEIIKAMNELLRSNRDDLIAVFSNTRKAIDILQSLTLIEALNVKDLLNAIGPDRYNTRKVYRFTHLGRQFSTYIRTTV